MRAAPLLMVVFVLAGCGANVTMFGHTVSKGKQAEKEPVAQQVPAGAAEAGAAAQAGKARAEPVVRDVLLSLNATLKQQIATDAHFDSETLHASIATELRSRGLMGPPESTSGTAIDILIDTYSLQATTSAALGRVASLGRIAGLVRVLDETGKERRSFKAQAEATLQVPAKGGDPAALSALYTKFAEQVAAGLAAN
jgi:hypothetical protein